MTTRPLRIDAHQHYWCIARGDYGWLTPDLSALYRDFGPSDLKPLLDRHGIDGTVLVQAAPTLAETRYLLDIAASCPDVLGVVGWVALDQAGALQDMAALTQSPKLKGLRPMLQDLDDDWITSAPIDPALCAMAERGLVFDALVKPGHLKALGSRLRAHPDLQVVIDHAAKPGIGSGDFGSWRRDLAAIADLPQVSCKMSGLLTEAPAGADVEMLQPYVDAVLECFGPDRVMWGSDWPVLTSSASYDDWAAMTKALLRPVDDADRTAIMGGTATRVYRL